ncbi:survival motor neuron protein [Drosophila nasuta]|uniref:survival motor neuron protein n=1 Tax=Drosophila nasuta TaxID=42062 RepID=UPI00295E68BD|nr:survival motor neuron protein [Drosophila nasuta]
MSEDKDAWDDSLLVKAYDDSVNLARETLARRIADSTNNRREENEADENEKPDMEQTENKPFKVGDFARATYTDGLDYEGKVASINEQAQTCILRYVGYENEQEIPLAELLPTWGADARRLQHEVAKADAEDAEAEPTAQQQRVKNNNKKPAAAKGKQQATSSRASGLSMPPMPMVPPMFASSSAGVDGEPDQDFVAMLTAWYMSGYYTGLYQGRKEGGAKKKAAKK